MYRPLNVVRMIKSRRLRWAGHVVGMEEIRSAFKILNGNLIGKTPSRRSMRRWEDSIRIDLIEIHMNTAIWDDSAQDMDYWRAHVFLKSTILIRPVTNWGGLYSSPSTVKKVSSQVVQQLLRFREGSSSSFTYLSFSC